MLQTVMKLRFTLLMTIGLCYLIGNASSASLALRESTGCEQGCKLIINNGQKTYRKFQEKVKIKAIRFIFILFKTEGTYLNVKNFYVWSRAVVGKPVFTLPMNYIAACFFLPIIFTDTLEIDVTESQKNCYNEDYDCHKNIAFQTLIDMTRIHKCNDETCDTICHRDNSMDFFRPFLKLNYSCCDVHKVKYNSTDVSSCTEVETEDEFYPLNIIIFTTAILAIIPLYILIAKRYLRWQGR